MKMEDNEKKAGLDDILKRFGEHVGEKVEIVYDDKGENDKGQVVISENGKPAIKYAFTDMLIGRILDREIKQILAVTEKGKVPIYDNKKDEQIYIRGG